MTSAIEFVKKYGIEETLKFIHFDSEIEIVYTPAFFEELKQIVEAFELVEIYGGLDEAPFFIYEETGENCYYNEELEKAIKLVEQCK